MQGRAPTAAAARHAGDQGASASQALPLLMLTVAASLALRSNGGLLYDVLDPAVAGGVMRGRTRGDPGQYENLLDASSGCRMGPAGLLKRG